MVDNLSKEKRSKIMRSVHSKDTKPELIVRKLLTRLGYRYRLHRKDLPGSPDIVFPGRKKVIFVNGCFWHMHNNCKLSHIPDSPSWKEKLEENKRRDIANYQAITSKGWDYLVIWECNLDDLVLLEEKLVSYLEAK